MASSVLRNDQQVKQKPVPHTADATGNDNVINTQIGKGSGKVLNGVFDNTSNKKAAPSSK